MDGPRLGLATTLYLLQTSRCLMEKMTQNHQGSPLDQEPGDKPAVSSRPRGHGGLNSDRGLGTRRTSYRCFLLGATVPSTPMW